MPLTRKTPLRRNTPLRAKPKPYVKLDRKECAAKRPFFARARIDDQNFYRRKPKPMPKMSKKQAKRLRSYYPISNAFLLLPQNRFCLICLCRHASITWREMVGLIGEMGDSFDQWASRCSKLSRATEVHHWAGRAGSLLTYEPYFIPSCRACREWPHTATLAARDLDLLAPAALFNVMPKLSS